MRNLKNYSFFYLVLFAGVLGCATSKFRISKQQGLKTEISVTPDRVTLECAKVSDENEFYMFIILILDEENTVISVVQGNNSDQEDCEKRRQSVEKILTTGKHIYLGGMGKIKKPRENHGTSYHFPKLGTFQRNGRILQFMVIANENGVCYGAYTGHSKPCPRDEFPIIDAH